MGVKILLLVIASSFYQPDSNIYVALLFINMVFNFRKNKGNFTKDTFKELIVYGISLVVYYIISIILFKIYPDVAFRSDIIDLNIKSLKFSYEYSLKDFLDLNTSFKNEKMFIFAEIACVMSIVNIVFVLIKKNIKKELNDRDLIFFNIILPCLPILLFLTIWGPFILLKELFFNPRDFPVFGVFFFAFGYVLNINKLKYINFIYITSLILSILSFSYVYGNALNQDYMYKKYVYDSISMKLEDIKGEIGDKKIIIYGRQAMTSYEGMALQVHPFLSKILFPADTNFFKEYNIAARNVYNIQGGVVMDNLKEWDDICVNKIPPIVSNGNYDIFNFKDHVSVWFKSNPIFCKSYPTDVNSVFERKAILLK